MCKYAYNHDISIPFFLFLGGREISALFNLEFQPYSECKKEQIFFSTIPLKPLHGIQWNFVDIKDTICECAYHQEILFHIYFFYLFIFIPALSNESSGIKMARNVLWKKVCIFYRFRATNLLRIFNYISCHSNDIIRIGRHCFS